MPEVSSERKLGSYFAWVVDAMPDVAFKWKLRGYFAWIVDDTQDVAFERKFCVQTTMMR